MKKYVAFFGTEPLREVVDERVIVISAPDDETAEQAFINAIANQMSGSYDYEEIEAAKATNRENIELRYFDDLDEERFYPGIAEYSYEEI